MAGCFQRFLDSIIKLYVQGFLISSTLLSSFPSWFCASDDVLVDETGTVGYNDQVEFVNKKV